MAQTIRKDIFDSKSKVIVTIDDLTEELSLNEEISTDELHEEKMLELQLTMATTSINHEYAKIEYDESPDYERRGELLAFMADCRGKYLDARNQLARFNPLVLETFEKDLILQKLATITHYHA